jgi:hypothetical protein
VRLNIWNPVGTLRLPPNGSTQKIRSDPTKPEAARLFGPYIARNVLGPHDIPDRETCFPSTGLKIQQAVESSPMSARLKGKSLFTRKQR